MTLAQKRNAIFVILVAIVAGAGSFLTIQDVHAQALLKDGQTIVIQGKYIKDISILDGRLGAGLLNNEFTMRLAPDVDVIVSLPILYLDPSENTDTEKFITKAFMSVPREAAWQNNVLAGKELEIKGKYLHENNRIYVAKDGDYIKEIDK